MPRVVPRVVLYAFFSYYSLEEMCRSEKVEIHHPLRESDNKLYRGLVVWACLGLWFMHFVMLFVGGSV
jgi:hypothetical protein